jgi:hypothetical protein
MITIIMGNTLAAEYLLTRREIGVPKLIAVSFTEDPGSTENYIQAERDLQAWRGSR